MQKNNLLGIGFKLINCLLFPVMSLVILHCSETVPIWQVIFSQTLSGSLITLVVLFLTKTSIPLIINRNDFLLYLGRSLSNLFAMYLWINALGKLGINEATALGYTGPLWVFLMARYIIGEKFNSSILFLIFINMVGMVIILEPKFADMPWEGVAGAMGSILLWSIYEIICKKQTVTQHYILQSFYFLVISTVILAPFVIFKWQAVNFEQVLWLTSTGLIGVANITAIFMAFSLAPLMLLAPFSYTRLVFTVILTAIILKTTPNIQTFIGAAIIMGANLYITYNVKKKEI